MTRSFLGFGVGLRHCHFDVFLENKQKSISWVEALTENYLPWADEKPRRPFLTLEKIRGNLPVALHGVSLSIGSADALDHSYLRRLKNLVSAIDPCWVSDHLCWTGVDGENLHDLLPLPYTEEAIKHIVEKVMVVQEYLGRPILLENVSSYVEFATAEMPEWEFLTQIARRSGSKILLDINNVYVSYRNHGFDPNEYLAAVPAELVGQIHLAGHSDKGDIVIDTHDEFVCDAVWNLYRSVAKKYSKVSTMIEWDDNIPEWPVLEAEVMKAKKIWEAANERVTHSAPASF